MPAESAAGAGTGPHGDDEPGWVQQVRQGYAFDGPGLELGVLMTDADRPTDVKVRIPVGLLNRHVMSDRGAPTPVAHTMLRPSESLTAPAAEDVAAGVVATSADAAQQFMRTAAREIARGIVKVGRR